MINKEISNIIRSRKSVYPNEFNGNIISEDIIMELLTNANHAPTHKITQPWIFKIFSSHSKQKLLEEIMKNDDITENKIQKLNEKFNKSSHIICICMKKNDHLLPEWEEIAATAMAVQNLWLSCAGSNIGGYWSTPKYINRLSKVLSLNADERCLGLFYLGIYESKKIKNIKREDIHKKIQWYR